MLSLTTILLGAALCLPQQGLDQSETRSITVTGIGRVTAVPDIAHVTVGVQTEGKTATEALKTNSDRMRAVLAVIRAAGIAERDIQTVGFAVYPVSETMPDREIRRYYRVTNTVRVTVRKLDQLGKLLDDVVEAAANQVNSIQFDVSRRKELEDEARKLAVEDAQRKAALLASAAGVELGDVLSIGESGGVTPSPIVLQARQAMAADVSIARGELEITATVHMVFGIR